VRPHTRFLLLSAFASLMLVGFAPTSEAQGRGGHGGGHGGGGGVHGGGVRGGTVVVAGGGYYSPYYDPYFYADPWYGYQYPYPPAPYGYGYQSVPADSAVRLEVKPKNAEVYVDGFYAGIVDDFDGTFQRLRVEPGEHEIELWLEGYVTVRQKVYLTPDNTFRIKYSMERLAAGLPQEPKPQPIEPPGGNQPRMQAPMPQPPMGRGPSAPRMPPQPNQPQQPQQPQQPGDNLRVGQGNPSYGSLAIRVQPGDAEVSIDGEAWRGPGGGDRLVVEVAEGSHTVEIRKAGYRTYVTQVDVRRGQTTPLNVSLRGEPQ
jgi:hypothetical protein